MINPICSTSSPGAAWWPRIPTRRRWPIITPPAHRLLWVRSHRRQPAHRPSGAAADAAPLPAGGHTPVAALVGGPPALSRSQLQRPSAASASADRVQGWASLSAQIRALLPASEGLAAPRLVNNADWMGQMSALDFLRDIGKCTSVNAMLARGIGAPAPSPARIRGISFTEFSTPCLQSRDFAVLNLLPPCRSAATTSQGQHHRRHGSHPPAPSDPGL